jgi:glycosyltransferase involved in cell wall biosynthesis
MGMGGAQRQLCAMARGLVGRGHEVQVAVFYREQNHEEELLQSGAQLLHLQKRGRWDNFGFLVRLWRTVRHNRFDVIYGLLSVSNLLVVALRLTGVPAATVCGVRASDMLSGRYDWLSNLALRLERALAPRADLVIANSRAGQRFLDPHTSHRNIIVIENGIDVDRLCWSAQARVGFRERLGIGPETALIGMIARLDPMKDHENFLQAAARVLREKPDARFLCVGEGPAERKRYLKQLAEQLSLHSAFQWLDKVDDVCAVYSALDVLCLSSAYGEGFPNVVAEAMACGVPCVATNVGDTDRILSDADFLVPARDPDAAATAILAALRQGRSKAEVRMQKIRSEFSVDALAAKTEAALAAVVREKRTRPGAQAA